MDFYLITYDIPEDKPRLKLANVLEDYGKRVQYSVFEAWLSPNHLEELYTKIEKILAGQAGQVRFYRLCAHCQKTVKMIGTQDLPKPPPDFLII
jgi:CRISPR-associated protein Cas2